MTSRLKLLLVCIGIIGLMEVVAIGTFGAEGIGVQQCLILSFAVAWAMEKEK